ncbi:hypothetical protein BGZ57DRAFT_929289 [Hyaloscypha finlandica]|nr:hypothetical protein BGZ57DRAFT_929289 [Hyaloscypha finlandica]
MASEAQPVTTPVALEPNLGNKMVTIYVGPKRKEFTIHKKLICGSADYFEKAFNGDFKEGREGIMYLPEDNSGVFSFFVDWLYRSTLPAGHTQPYLANLYHLWIFATKICHTKLADNVMDRIQDTCKEHHWFISDELLKEIWGLTETESKLRRWAIDLNVYQMFENKGSMEDVDDIFWHIDDNRYKDLWKLLQNDFDLFKTFLIKFEYMTQCRNEGFPDPRRSRESNQWYCTYHSHEEEKCVAARLKLK